MIQSSTVPCWATIFGMPEFMSNIFGFLPIDGQVKLHCAGGIVGIASFSEK